MVELYEDDDVGDGDADHAGEAAPGHREVAAPRHRALITDVIHQVLDILSQSAVIIIYK